MTNIQIRLRIEEPTDKINPKSVEPILKKLRLELKKYMELHLPKDSKIKVKRITKAKKDKAKKSINCLICHKDFKTIMSERKLCSKCVRASRGIDINPEQVRTSLPPSGLPSEMVREDLFTETTIPQPRRRDNNDYLEFWNEQTGMYERL